MKIKILAGFGLSAALFVAGCGGGATNTNTNANANRTNTAVVTTPTALPQTNVAANTDPNLKSKIESALKAKGFNDVTVDTSTTPATLRGSVPKGKLAEVVQAAQEANGGKPVKNEVQEK
jgi:hypothetical protein